MLNTISQTINECVVCVWWKRGGNLKKLQLKSNRKAKRKLQKQQRQQQQQLQQQQQQLNESSWGKVNHTFNF